MSDAELAKLCETDSDGMEFRLRIIDRKLEDGVERICQKLEELYSVPGSVTLAGTRSNTFKDQMEAVTLHDIDKKLQRLVTKESSLPTPKKENKTNKFLRSVTQQIFDSEMSYENMMSSSDENLKRVSFTTRSGDVEENVSSIALRRIFRKASTKESSVLNQRSRAERMDEIHMTIATHQQKRGRCAAYVWRFLENPHSSIPAQLYSAFLPCVVIGSVFLSFWETVDSFPIDSASAEYVQTGCEVIFAVELLLRFWVCPDRCDFWKSLFNYVDLMTIIPLAFRILFGFLSITIGSDASAEDALKKLALLPVLRLLKLTRRFEKFQLLLSAFLIAVEALPVLLYTLLIIALIFAALIFFVEPRDNIESLPHALWFILVTMTTVGYGDVTPDTTTGQIITTVLMIISGLYMAIPIGIVGNAFSQVWGARDRLLLMHRMRDAFLQQGFSAKALASIVSMFDGTGSGELEMEDFEMMLEAMHISISPDRVRELWESFDEDRSGSISVDELLNGLFPQDYAQFFNNLTAVPTAPSAATVTTGGEILKSSSGEDSRRSQAWKTSAEDSRKSQAYKRP